MSERAVVVGLVDTPRREGRAAEWTRRYAPAELLALVGALVGYLSLELSGAGHVAAAYGAAFGDAAGYYGLLVAREVRRSGVVRAARALALEFGPAEALDSMIVRPAFVALATDALGTAAGVLVAKVAADVVFYVGVIASYELQRSRRSCSRGAQPAKDERAVRVGLR